ncbi:MAG: carboxylating nicotinate-nucleotide diphosphorylase [Flavobacteriales bacterium]|nr:carboxylating nicotinate-nucleotide diphosphorylase [Flavobacteriales bacterium]
MIDFLNHLETHRIIREALFEDIGPGDYTSLSTIPTGQFSRAQCLIKDDGILAGVAFAEKVFETVDPHLKMEVVLPDGTTVVKGDVAFFVEGDPRSILQAERLVLNVMQRMSGIATYTRNVVDLLKNTSCRVLDTRKTTPLIRHLEKWAVFIGGGVNHRFGLYDMIMIKDNHIDYAGGITAALTACKSYLKKEQLTLKIEVETRNLEEIREVLNVGGIDRIMLDNMSLEMMRKAVDMIGNQAETEASGGITLERVRAIAETGVDFISMGALTHSIKSLDISLKALTR